jgi:hypothetical protein
MHVNSEPTGLYGLMAEFDSAQGIVDASTKAVAEGYTRLEAYTPFPIEELNDISHKKRTILPKAPASRCSTGPRRSSTRSTSAAGRWRRGRPSSCRRTS